jgi:thioredoxin-like negative regulator of GroEL
MSNIHLPIFIMGITLGTALMTIKAIARFSIQSIPTLMLVHRGREIARKSGLMPLPQLLAWTREHVDGMKVQQDVGVDASDRLQSNPATHPISNLLRLVLPSGR